MKKITLLLCLMFYGFQNVAQVTYEGNTSVFSNTDYVGWDNGITNPLRIKHEANQDNSVTITPTREHATILVRQV
jgi:hypothetical protein